MLELQFSISGACVEGQLISVVISEMDLLFLLTLHNLRLDREAKAPCQMKFCFPGDSGFPQKNKVSTGLES